jgi:hypothetical protein
MEFLPLETIVTAKEGAKTPTKTKSISVVLPTASTSTQKDELPVLNDSNIPKAVKRGIVKVSAAEATDRQLEGMNKTEAAYYQYLLELKRTGKIRDVSYECEKLKLAKSTYYTPDFRVILCTGEVEFHETKGFWRDDARVKIKVAATLHPYRFYIVQKKKGGWDLSLVEV